VYSRFFTGNWNIFLFAHLMSSSYYLYECLCGIVSVGMMTAYIEVTVTVTVTAVKTSNLTLHILYAVVCIVLLSDSVVRNYAFYLYRDYIFLSNITLLASSNYNMMIIIFLNSFKLFLN
jgi:hypothetical protein